MPDLLQSLQKLDSGHLHIVAELWGLDIPQGNLDDIARQIRVSILDPALVAEILEVLPPDALNALMVLQGNNGRVPWTEFIRRFGEIREMGASKRDREKPYRNPISPAETLFYRALLARAFFPTAEGLREFAYIPDDLLTLIGQLRFDDFGEKRPKALGRPALPREKMVILAADDSILDDATTLLAALRMGFEPADTKVPVPDLKGILESAQILLDTGPDPEIVKVFLEAPRGEALKMLADAWIPSATYDELRRLTGLVFEGEWKNDPPRVRSFLFEALGAIPPDSWWSLPALVADIKTNHPDFQRPSGDYDSWFIRRNSDGEYLRGFEYWDQVDGELIRFLITGPLYWLGRVDLAAPREGKPSSAFLVRTEVPISDNRQGRLHVSSQGGITIPGSVSRAVRYQVARFCDWLPAKGGESRYLLTPGSLERAAGQGLKIEQLLSLLARHSSAGVPPSLVKALKRWELGGTEARMRKQVVLRVSRPEVLEELRKSRAARFLGEVLGPTAVIVKEGARAKVLAALAELGLLAEDEK